MTSLEMAQKAAVALDAKKATDVVVRNVGTLSTLADYFVIASGGSNTHVKALADEVDEQLGKSGVMPKRVEGYQTSAWILMDYGDVLVHIFCHETRDFYALERLWADAPKEDLSQLLKAD